MASLRFDPGVPLLPLSPLRTELSRTRDSISYEVDGELLSSRINQVVQDPFYQLSETCDTPLSPKSQSNAQRIKTVRENVYQRRLKNLDAQISPEEHLIYKDFLQHSWSFRTYMEESLYGKDGYYTSKADIGTDFSTANTHGECLARQIVNQAMLMYMKMAEAKDISGEHFDMVECGAGTGAMAYNILSYIEILGKTNPTDENIQKFCKAVHYTIGEISPGLKAKQILLNQRFIDQGKLTIVQADARKLQNHFRAGQFSGVFVSNELPDAFPVHCIHISHEDKIFVLKMVPLIHRNLLAYMPEEETWEFIDQDIILREKFSGVFNLENDMNDMLVASAEKVYSLKPEVRKNVLWKHAYVPVSYYPEIIDFLKTHPIFLERINHDIDIYINVDAPQFINGVSAIMKKGFAITVDYGAPFESHSHETLREFGKEKEQRSHIHPKYDFHNGFQVVDLTVDVCYQSLAESSSLLKPLGVIFQRELNRTMRAIGKKTFETERIKKSQEHSSRDYDVDSFIALVQVKEGTNALYGIPAKMQPTTREQIIDAELNGNADGSQLENRSRLYASAWLDYSKNRNDIDATEFGIFCKELYGNEFEPDRIVAEGIVKGEIRGNIHQQKLITATLQAIKRAA